MAPFDSDDDIEVKLTKTKELDVSLSKCNPVRPNNYAVACFTHGMIVIIQFTMLREVSFEAENVNGELLPFTQPIRINSQDYHFKEICFY